MDKKERSRSRNNLGIRKLKNINRKFSSESDESSKGENQRFQV